MSENVAGWLGSSIGGVTYDQMGFENSTLIVIAMQVLALLAILYLGKCNASQHETNGEEEREKLLSKEALKQNPDQFNSPGESLINKTQQ